MTYIILLDAPAAEAVATTVAAGASESSVAASGDSTVAPAAPAAPVSSEAVSVAAGTIYI